MTSPDSSSSTTKLKVWELPVNYQVQIGETTAFGNPAVRNGLENVWFDDTQSCPILLELTFEHLPKGVFSILVNGSTDVERFSLKEGQSKIRFIIFGEKHIDSFSIKFHEDKDGLFYYSVHPINTNLGITQHNYGVIREWLQNHGMVFLAKHTNVQLGGGYWSEIMKMIDELPDDAPLTTMYFLFSAVTVNPCHFFGSAKLESGETIAELVHEAMLESKIELSDYDYTECNTGSPFSEKYNERALRNRHAWYKK